MCNIVYCETLLYFSRWTFLAVATQVLQDDAHTASVSEAFRGRAVFCRAYFNFLVSRHGLFLTLCNQIQEFMAQTLQAAHSSKDINQNSDIKALVEYFIILEFSLCFKWLDCNDIMIILSVWLFSNPGTNKQIFFLCLSYIPLNLLDISSHICNVCIIHEQIMRVCIEPRHHRTFCYQKYWGRLADELWRSFWPYDIVICLDHREGSLLILSNENKQFANSFWLSGCASKHTVAPGQIDGPRLGCLGQKECSNFPIRQLPRPILI